MRFEKIEKIRKKLHINFGEYVEPIGRSGGMAIWWKGNIQINFSLITNNIVHMNDVVWGGKSIGAITWVYGPNEEREKLRWWKQMEKLNCEEGKPWLILGDFNDILYNFEKEGGREDEEGEGERRFHRLPR